MKSEKRSCLTCSTELHGRGDQRFCCDQCRVTHHNFNNRDVSKFMTNINNILRKNRRIMQTFNPYGKTARVTKAQMLDEGYKFSYFTNEYVTKAKRVYRFCYEQGFIELEPEVYTLVVRHQYVE